ncbi:MAG: type II toxin-antitoxin system PemK/MazF family toxin [Nanoarchaeota archaeon]
MILQRDILLVPFPFSDQSGKKVRPVVVISNSSFNNNSEDILVLGLTSNISKDKYTSLINKTDLEEGELEMCCIKVENILKLDKTLVIKKIGRINKNKLKETILILSEIIKED